MDRRESEMAFDGFLSWSETSLGFWILEQSVKSSSKLLALAPVWSHDYKDPFEFNLRETEEKTQYGSDGIQKPSWIHDRSCILWTTQKVPGRCILEALFEVSNDQNMPKNRYEVQF